MPIYYGFLDSLGMRWSVLALESFSICITDAECSSACPATGLVLSDRIGDCGAWCSWFALSFMPFVTIMFITPLSAWSRTDLYVLGDRGASAMESEETFCFTCCLIFFKTWVSYRASKFCMNSFTRYWRMLDSGLAGLLEGCLD